MINPLIIVVVLIILFMMFRPQPYGERMTKKVQERLRGCIQDNGDIAFKLERDGLHGNPTNRKKFCNATQKQYDCMMKYGGKPQRAAGQVKSSAAGWNCAWAK
jgi:hypothetical protein